MNNPAPKHGPAICLRFRDQHEKRAAILAAERSGSSFNTWALDALARAVRDSYTPRTTPRGKQGEK